MVAIGDMHELRFPDRLELACLHQAAHTMTPDLDTLFHQRLTQTATAIALPGRFEQAAQPNPRAAKHWRLPNSAAELHTVPND